MSKLAIAAIVIGAVFFGAIFGFAPSVGAQEQDAVAAGSSNAGLVFSIVAGLGAVGVATSSLLLAHARRRA